MFDARLAELLMPGDVANVVRVKRNSQFEEKLGPHGDEVLSGERLLFVESLIEETIHETTRSNTKHR